MKYYERRFFRLILIFIIIFIIWSLYFYNSIIEFNVNLKIPLESKNYLTFIWILVSSFWGLFWWLYKLDLQEEKEKHLHYIRTINDRIWNKIDWNFFSDIKKARDFCKKEKYYIVPYWYRYNISEIDFSQIIPNFNKNWEEISKNTKIDEYKKFNDINQILNKLENENIWENKNVKTFLEIDDFINYLDKENEWNKLEDNYRNENLIYKNNITLEQVLSLIESRNDFIIIEWYLYLYKF